MIGAAVISTAEGLGAWRDAESIGRGKFDVIVERGTAGDVYDALPDGWYLVRFYLDDGGDVWSFVQPSMVRER